MHYKLKSEMKAYYHKANVPTARYHIVSTLEAGKEFISKVGYPVVVKPVSYTHLDVYKRQK